MTTCVQPQVRRIAIEDVIAELRTLLAELRAMHASEVTLTVLEAQIARLVAISQYPV